MYLNGSSLVCFCSSMELRYTLGLAVNHKDLSRYSFSVLEMFPHRVQSMRDPYDVEPVFRV